MRGWCVVALISGCTFPDGKAAPPDGAAGAGGFTIEPLPCPMTRAWVADFSSDPTTQNLNGDPELDWHIREGGALPGLLADGIWSIATTTPAAMISLDTQPKVDFNRRTRAIARLRATSAGTRGVMVWLDVDYTPMTFMPLYLELQLDGADQVATLHGKDELVELTFATFTGLGTGFVDVMLDVDPMNDRVDVRVGDQTSSHVYTPIPRMMNDDRFATLVAYGSDGEFDEAKIEVCR